MGGTLCPVDISHCAAVVLQPPHAALLMNVFAPLLLPLLASSSGATRVMRTAAVRMLRTRGRHWRCQCGEAPAAAAAAAAARRPPSPPSSALSPPRRPCHRPCSATCPTSASFSPSAPTRWCTPASTHTCLSMWPCEWGHPSVGRGRSQQGRSSCTRGKGGGGTGQQQSRLAAATPPRPCLPAACCAPAPPPAQCPTPPALPLGMPWQAEGPLRSARRPPPHVWCVRARGAGGEGGGGAGSCWGRAAGCRAGAAVGPGRPTRYISLWACGRGGGAGGGLQLERGATRSGRRARPHLGHRPHPRPCTLRSHPQVTLVAPSNQSFCAGHAGRTEALTDSLPAAPPPDADHAGVRPH